VLLVACVGSLGIWGCKGKPSYSGSIGREASVRAAAADPLTVSPLAGTLDASPATQISFLGRRGTRVAGVRVLGSRSGLHRGSLRAFSTGTGESFLPAVPFQPGEQVTVSARVAGARRKVASTSFTVARQVAVSAAEFPRNPGDPGAVQHYRSAPELAPSTVTVTTRARPGATAGELFLAPYQGEGAPGPMIVDQDGELVWFHPLPTGLQASNFGVQRYQGREVLTWWQGRIIQAGFGQGEDQIYDSSYRRVATVRAGNGYQADLHEIRLTSQGTAWIDAFDPVEAERSAVHGSSGSVLTDSVVQQIDIKTGLVMWEWHALGHIPPEDSYVPVASGGYPWDYAHVNSVAPGPSGDVLLSARSTCAVYDVDVHSGRVRWRLGGKRSSFKLQPDSRFYWQHDAEFQPGGLISLFDNGSEPPKEKQSRGLLFRLDTASGSAAVVKQLVNPTRTLLASSQGAIVRLPGGNWLLGYGGLPDFTEFDDGGHVLLDGTLGRNVQNFRVNLSPWVGRPRTPPSLRAWLQGVGRLALAVSWNGASEVAAWRVLCGASPRALAPVARARRLSFETEIATRASGRYVAVQALDRAGKVIGVSPVARV
jgi:hypothetical protein